MKIDDLFKIVKQARECCFGNPEVEFVVDEDPLEFNQIEVDTKSPIMPERGKLDEIEETCVCEFEDKGVQVEPLFSPKSFFVKLKGDMAWETEMAHSHMEAALGFAESLLPGEYVVEVYNGWRGFPIRLFEVTK